MIGTSRLPIEEWKLLELRNHLNSIAQEWHTRPSGYVIEQRKTKLLNLLRKYGANVINDVADARLKEFQRDLDDLMNGANNE